MKLLTEIEFFEKSIDKKSKTIADKKTKDQIDKIYHLWISFVEDVKRDFPNNFLELEKNFNVFYSFKGKHHFEKKEIKKTIRILKKILDSIRIKIIKQGISFKENFKEKIYEYLNGRTYLASKKYLKEAETNIKKDPEVSCGKCRESIEELLRVIREKVEGNKVPTGTLGQHTAVLEKKGLISPLENRFLKGGLYSFLSEKGNHANTERKDEIDAIFGFKLTLITIEYLKNMSLF
ncbi:hypothetical protein KAT80_02265 [Candidatus Pacearchaeota archaeon]|nr:hypothetical protein [Candidatus Pacearchaeota archaeon]